MPARRPRVLLAAVLFVGGASLARAADDRDPFTFGPRVKPITSTALVAAPTLLGVLWDATAPLAMIGDRMVAKGESVGDCRVAKIQQDGIWVECAGARHFVTPGSPLPVVGAQP